METASLSRFFARLQSEPVDIAAIEEAEHSSSSPEFYQEEGTADFETEQAQAASRVDDDGLLALVERGAVDSTDNGSFVLPEQTIAVDDFLLIRRRVGVRLLLCLVSHGVSALLFWMQLFMESSTALGVLGSWIIMIYTSHGVREYQDILHRTELRILQTGMTREELDSSANSGIIFNILHQMNAVLPATENGVLRSTASQAAGVSEEIQQNSWKTVSFDVEEGSSDTTSTTAGCCSICLVDYETGDELTQLPCQHLYHPDCIKSWTVNHAKCPLCNFNLAEAGDVV